MIDLRSDTVTKPTPAMRRAMAEAEVGDDVYGEDPTVNRLEQRAADATGMEAAVFLPTGTMGNTIAIKLLTEHGQEVLCDARAHLLDYELAMTAWFSGCLIRPIQTPDGILRWSDIRRSVKPLGAHWAPTACIEIENTHNMAGGRVYPQDVIDEICDGAHALGVKVHIDGARIFNAAEASGTPVRRIVAKADMVTFCLSKALGAPVGSMLAGSKALIDKGRLYRKRLGGGMRQAGLLAACGIVSLTKMVDRLAEDHARAKRAALVLAELPGLSVNIEGVQTNMVMVDTDGPAEEVVARLAEEGVLCFPNGPQRIRLVFHADVDDAKTDRAIEAFRAVTRGKVAA